MAGELTGAWALARPNVAGHPLRTQVFWFTADNRKLMVDPIGGPKTLRRPGRRGRPLSLTGGNTVEAADVIGDTNACAGFNAPGEVPSTIPLQFAILDHGTTLTLTDYLLAGVPLVDVLTRISP